MRNIVAVTMMVMALLCGGCRNLYTGIVTITEIRHSVMNDLGDELRAGRISAEQWQKVVAVDEKYRTAAKAARITLETYRDLGTGDPAAAILSVKGLVLELINILAGYQGVEAQREQLTKATKL